MSSRLLPLLIGAGVLLVFAALSLFSVSETEFAIRTEFGKIVGIDYTPGLHVKWPWDVVTKFDSRILSQSYTGETFLTNDGRGLIVDFYVKWRVKDPSLYFTATADWSSWPASVWRRSSRTGSRAWWRNARCSRSSPPSVPRSPARCLARRAATRRDWAWTW